MREQAKSSENRYCKKNYTDIDIIRCKSVQKFCFLVQPKDLIGVAVDYCFPIGHDQTGVVIQASGEVFFHESFIFHRRCGHSQDEMRITDQGNRSEKDIIQIYKDECFQVDWKMTLSIS